MTVLGTARLVSYGLVILLSIIVLGLSHIGDEYVMWALDYFVGLAIAVSFITLATLVPVLIIERIRQNSFLSWTSVELSWLGVLWVLWLVSAATSSSSIVPLPSVCHSPTTVASAFSLCVQLQARVALSWVIWILLTGILVWILGFAIGAHLAGHRGIWRASASQMSGGVGPTPRSTKTNGNHEQGFGSSDPPRQKV